MKASLYLITFQIHKQRGTFDEVDTYSIKDHGQFSFSKISQEAEARSLINHPDVNAHSISSRKGTIKVHYKFIMRRSKKIHREHTL